MNSTGTASRACRIRASSDDEVAGFWACRIRLEARFVPDDELGHTSGHRLDARIVDETCNAERLVNSGRV